MAYRTDAGEPGPLARLQADGTANAEGTVGPDTLTGTPSGDSLNGGAGDDSLAGLDGGDTLSGSFGNDTLVGGRGVDTLLGGDGADLFYIAQGDAAAATPDVISDWSGEDQIRTNGFLSSYQEASAPDAGRTYANSLIAAGAKIVAVQTSSGVIVYMDTAGDGGSAEDAILLSGRTLDDVSAANFGAVDTLPTAPMGPPDTAPPPPPPPPPGPAATAGPDTLTGSAGGDSINGLGGGDRLDGGDGDDTLDGGAGADTITGGTGADRFIFGVGESGTTEGSIDQIVDNLVGGTDRLVFGGGRLINSYVEISGPTNYAAALAAANEKIASGVANFVFVRAGNDAFVFVDSRNDDGQADDAVQLPRNSLDLININNMVALPPPDPEPEVPRSPGAGQQGVRGSITGNMDAAHLSRLLGETITDATISHLAISGPAATLDLGGFVFSYDNRDQLTGGQVIGLSYRETGFAGTSFSANLTTPYISAAPFGGWVQFDQTQEAFASILRTDDWIRGGAGSDLLRTFAGNDFIEGYGGNDTLFGGEGSDAIFANFSPVQGPPPPGSAGPVGSTYLRGDEGNDFIVGAAGFDDINGNMGNDTLEGGDADDWVVGGKDNDQVFGEAGSDLVYGNLGDDTCVGGAGNDIVRGGQGNDILWGSAGNDFVSGDRGDDTLTGGDGADSFHGSQDAGIDRVLDFNLAQGDRVQLDPGTTYSVRQVGFDTVIDMGEANQMILVGVQMPTLTPGWIFGA